MMLQMPSKRTNPSPALLRKARLEAGLTQEQAAERAGLTRTSISRYETEGAYPSALALNMMASLYNKPVQWFYGDQQESGSEGKVETDDIDIADPDLSLFFRGEWDTFTEDEKDFIKGMIRESRDLLRKRREAGNADS